MIRRGMASWSGVSWLASKAATYRPFVEIDPPIRIACSACRYGNTRRGIDWGGFNCAGCGTSNAGPEAPSPQFQTLPASEVFG